MRCLTRSSSRSFSARISARWRSRSIAVAAIVFLVQKVRLPVFLAVMATVVVYGIAADMTFQSVGKAFGLGFATAMEQTGLLVVAGALVGAVVLRAPLGTGTSTAAGLLAGITVAGVSIFSVVPLTFVAEVSAAAAPPGTTVRAGAPFSSCPIRALSCSFSSLCCWVWRCRCIISQLFFALLVGLWFFD